MNPITVITAWRDKRGIDAAIRDHDVAGLAKAVALAITFIVTCLRGTKYAELIAFASPDFVTGAGLVIAALIAGVGHWATRGALTAAAAGQGKPVDRESAQSTAQPADVRGARPAEPAAPVAMQSGPDAARAADEQRMQNAGG